MLFCSENKFVESVQVRILAGSLVLIMSEFAFEDITYMLRTITVAGVVLCLCTPAFAGSQVCGWYAFAGAHGNESRAQKEANKLNAMALDLRTSNSPNNHKKLWVVAEGPLTKAKAGRLAKKWKKKVGAGYIANRCFTGD